MLYTVSTKLQENTCHAVCYAINALPYILLQISRSYKFHNFQFNLDPHFKQDNSECQC